MKRPTHGRWLYSEEPAMPRQRYKLRGISAAVSRRLLGESDETKSSSCVCEAFRVLGESWSMCPLSSPRQRHLEARVRRDNLVEAKYGLADLNVARVWKLFRTRHAPLLA